MVVILALDLSEGLPELDILKDFSSARAGKSFNRSNGFRMPLNG
jgi:hypothetical protein